MIHFYLMAAVTASGSSGGGGGGGSSPPTGDPPNGPPSAISAYSYSGGTHFGIQWVTGDPAAQSELYRDGSLYDTLAIGVEQKDIGNKTGNGTHTWKVRHLRNAQYSAFGSEITTTDGVEL